MLLLVCGCGTGPAERSEQLAVNRGVDHVRAHQDSVNRSQPGYIIDSSFTPEEEMRRFLADLPNRPTAFSNGAASPDELIRFWIRAVERGDSLSLIRSVVNRPEFAMLVYPSSPYTRPPLRQSPAVVWARQSMSTIQGFRRTMSRLGGQPLHVVDWHCGRQAERQGENTVIPECRIRRVLPGGDTVQQRLFGPIVGRRGVFKFATLSSEM